MTTETKSKEVDVIKEAFNVVRDDAINNMKHDERSVYDALNFSEPEDGKYVKIVKEVFGSFSFSKQIEIILKNSNSISEAMWLAIRLEKIKKSFPIH